MVDITTNGNHLAEFCY